MDAQHYAIEIIKKLKAAGYIAYFAGGWVRDYLMDRPSSDIDIATNAPPDVILDLFPQTILVGLAFGVIIVVISGHQFEVSTFRRDVSYVNGRKPESIELSTPEEDALRRDFTINGMFYDPVTEQVYDYVHGLEDIKKGVIQTIGDPQERFMEDRLRMIRAIRFASRFGFAIDPKTQEGIIENADTLFPAVAMERVWHEFQKMSCCPRFDIALIEMHRLGLLPVIFPTLQSVHLKEIKNFVRIYNHFPEKTSTILYLIELFPKASLAELKELCQYLRTSNHEIDLVEYVFHGKRLIEREQKNDLSVTDVDWVYFYANPDFQTCLEVFAARLSDEERSSFLEFHRIRALRLMVPIERVVSKKPLISAAILKAQGILPGKLMGMLLREAESLAILNQLNSKDAVLKLLYQSSNWPKEEFNHDT